MSTPVQRTPLGPVDLTENEPNSNIIEVLTTTNPNFVSKQAPIDLTAPSEKNESSVVSNQIPTNFTTSSANNEASVVSDVAMDSSAVMDNLASSMTRIMKIDDEFDESAQGKHETVDWKKENKEMDKMFESHTEQQLQGLSEFVTPRGFKKTVNFYDYQKDGISWLVRQEMNAPPNPFVRSRVLTNGTTAFYDKLTKRKIPEAHAPVKGSILADDMGLGKTIQTLGLILSNPPEGYKYGRDIGNEIEAPICTIIVCPKSVISNWITQAKDFCKPRLLNIVTYTGTPKQRSKIIESVKDNRVDILLSTYETIASEFEKERAGLMGVHDVPFHRIVLDEAQQIRNNKSKTCKAIQAVADKSDYRLALTGTPFVNKPEDVASLLTFVGLEPLADLNTFQYFISDPIKDKKRAGLTRLRAAMSYVALRRTKNIVPNLKMAEKTVKICRIDFPNGKHKDIHDCLYFAAQAAFEASINGAGAARTESEGGITRNTQQAMFSLLTRVRQSCCSGELVAKRHFDVANKQMQGMKDENGALKQLTAKDGNCMIDELQYSGGDSKNNERLCVEGHSPKVEALLREMGNMQDDEKGVIFSQWTSYLDIIQAALVKSGHTVVRIDGSTSIDHRTAAIEALTHDDQTRFILCSLKAAGVGINLTRANVCFMMDTWWNAASEEQAIDRVHRVGQKRDVRVFRFVMAGTIEERLLQVQKSKSALGKGTMVKLSKGEESVAKVTSLKDLFQIKNTGDSIGDFIYNSDKEWF